MHHQLLVLVISLALTACSRPSFNTESIRFPTAQNPATAALYQHMRTALQVPEKLMVTFHPFTQEIDRPLSTISRTNYSFHHSRQTLPVTCCLGEKCLERNFIFRELNIRFPDDILTKQEKYDDRQIVEVIQRWLDGDCSKLWKQEG